MNIGPNLFHGLPGFGFDLEIQLGGKLDGPNHPHRVFLKASPGVVDGTNNSLLDVANSVHIVDHAVVGNVIEEAVDGEITAVSIFLRRTKPVVAPQQKVVLVEFGSTAKSGDFHNLPAREVDVGESKSATYEATVAKQLANLSGSSRSDNVEILWGPLEEEITNTATHQVGGVAGSIKSIENAKGPGGDKTSRNGVLATV